MLIYTCRAALARLVAWNGPSPLAWHESDETAAMVCPICRGPMVVAVLPEPGSAN